MRAWDETEELLRRAAERRDAEHEETLQERVFDGTADALPDDDVEPPAGSDDPALAALIDQAERLAGQSGDPKLKLLTEHLGQILRQQIAATPSVTSTRTTIVLETVKEDPRIAIPRELVKA